MSTCSRDAAGFFFSSTLRFFSFAISQSPSAASDFALGTSVSILRLVVAKHNAASLFKEVKWIVW
jgi:hypothetical protein